ncbi:MAG: DEAD/DEAH box helicase, partial [Bdellovibrionota bacterium]
MARDTQGNQVDLKPGIKLDTPVQFIKGVGPKLGDVLRKKGVTTVQDLLEWYPRAYEDRRAARNIASLKPEELVSLRARVVRVSSINMGASRRKMYDVTVTDGTGKIHCKFFRVPYKGYFERFQPNQQVRVIGKVTHYRGQIEFHHPDIQHDNPEKSGDEAGDESENQMIPISPESEGMTNRQLRKIVQLSISDIKKSFSAPQPEVRRNRYAPDSPKTVPYERPSGPKMAGGGRLPTAVRKSGPGASAAFDIPEGPGPIEKFPEWLREKYSLVERFEALENLHQPPNDAGPEFADQTSKFHRRIIFEEFFWLELYLAAKKSGLKKESAPAFKPKLDLVAKLRENLPFKLTGAQERSLGEIVKDLAKPHPMHRLVQGDVGSGKTLVALAASLVAHENGYQSAIMVPTEILAEQHYQNAVKFLEPLGLTVGLLTGSMKTAERRQTNEMLKNGLIHFVVGTHALIQEEVEFKNLGFVVIDEQHRFGVHQRSMLKRKGLSPHFLVMTATPIPRTLAMTVYG